ncbi:MAG: TonB-dependent receptor plug domain-containing protein [Solirubrobacteraceae bacterium]
MIRLHNCFYCVISIVFCANIYAQQDTLSLSEVSVTNRVLKEFSAYQNVKEISTSNKTDFPVGLTQILQTESSISLRENGRGMLSSPSFRGTTASQTAVVWQGININSTLVGQADFNLLNASDFQTIVVKSGGGSSLFGSNAIGGSIHLNTKLNFNQPLEQNLTFLNGSFDTNHLSHQLKIGGKRTAVQSSITYNQSKNDYPYVGYDNKNENGQFQNISSNFSLGHNFTNKFRLDYYSFFLKGEKNLSGTLTSVGKSKYDELNVRQLLDLSYHFKDGKIWQNKLAFLLENFEYYEDFQQKRTSNGDAKTLFYRQEFIYPISNKLDFHSQAEYNYQWTQGSNIIFADRHIGSASASLKYKVLKTLDTDFALRQEKSSIFQSPLLYSFQSRWHPIKSYALRFVHSKNYRIPTFNDLFWPTGGNINLIPEQSLQFDVSQDLFFKNGQFTLTYFNNQMQDMIVWQPNESDFWQPLNVQSVEINGFESKLQFNKSFKQLQTKLDLQYTYTSSKNLVNQKQLPYIPFHRITTQLNLIFKELDVNYQFQFNGQVFTNAKNTRFLKEYAFSNIFIGYNFQKFLPIKLKLQIINIENEFFQNVSDRPLPGRYINSILTFKF